jgi:hypothetical protein
MYVYIGGEMSFVLTHLASSPSIAERELGHMIHQEVDLLKEFPLLRVKRGVVAALLITDRP